MSDRPPFSVIIPTFNCASLLEETVRSVAAAAHAADVEVEQWVMDGASTDGTVDLLHHLTPEFSESLHFRSAPDAGVYDAMNKGIEEAQGRYLYFLGAGDKLRSDSLVEIVKYMPEHDRAILYGDVFLMDQSRSEGGYFSKLRLARRNLPHQGTFYGREVFGLIGNYSLAYKLLADYEFNLRVFGEKRIERRYVDCMVADFRGGGISAVGTDERFKRDFLSLVRRHLGWPLYLAVWLRQLLPPVIGQHVNHYLSKLHD